MKEKRNKKMLKRIDFDKYIWKCFTEFLDKEENHIETVFGKRLKDGVEFLWDDSKNRNPTQVPNDTWRRLLYKHIQRFHYN